MSGPWNNNPGETPAPDPWGAQTNQPGQSGQPAQPRRDDDATVLRPAVPPGQFGPPAQPYSQPAQPAQPYNQPAQPYNQPAQPYNQPAQPYGQPAQPYNQPAQPYNQPAQPYGQPGQFGAPGQFGQQPGQFGAPGQFGGFGAPPAPPKGKKTLFIAIGAVVVVLVVVVGAVLLFSGGSGGGGNSPTGAVNKFISAFKANDTKAAKAASCAADQSDLDDGPLQSALTKDVSFTVGKESKINDTQAKVSTTVKYTDATGSHSMTTDVYTRKESGTWKVCTSDNPN